MHHLKSPSTPAAAQPNLRAPQALLTRTEAAAYLGLSPQTLAADVTTQRLGLPMVKLGRRSMYRIEDLQAYCASHLMGAIKETEAR